MALVGLDVTYGDAAIGPPRFHRVTVPGGKAADINRKNLSVGSESKAVYLWSKTSKDPKKGREITDIKVLYGKNDVPEGYELLDRDLTLGGDPVVVADFWVSGMRCDALWWAQGNAVTYLPLAYLKNGGN